LGDSNSRKFDCFVPRGLLARLATAPEELVQEVDGTAVFADVSGFTRLSERLARVGKEGAEHLADTINACFSALLADAYAHGGSLLKFGGDALLLWFEGDDHAIRACASAAAMRGTLRGVGRIETSAGEVVVRVSVGVHSGSFETFLVGDSHREYLIAGPAASRVVAIEGAASTGQVLLSPETAAILPRGCLGKAVGPGVLLRRVPSVPATVPDELATHPSDDAVALCLPVGVRAHVSAGPATPEHRNATVAFVQFGGLDELIERSGPRAAADAVDEVVRAVQEAADLFQVCLLGSDIGADGGKLQLAAGAPRTLGDDEERMLLAVRHVLDRQPSLPVRIGVNRGHVFSGEIGPPYRRTYALMGDAVNLAARLMAKAPWGAAYATDGVPERSRTSFHSTVVPPFMAKGKLRPVQAVEVGPMRRPIREAVAAERVPLVGRDEELATIRDAVVGARAGRGGMVEIVGETGSGKSRLLAEARELAGGLRVAHTICESYRRTVPYVVWRDILRQLLGLHWDDPDPVVTAAILAQIEISSPELQAWLPLIAVAFDAQLPMTREVTDLAANYRAARLHEVVLQFLEPLFAVPTLIQIEHAHLMDEASAALLHAIADRLDSSAWLITVTRRDVTGGFVGVGGSLAQLSLGPLPEEAMTKLAEGVPEANLVPPHMLEMAVQRAGGSPEFLLDLLATAAGGSRALPDSIDAAATARIDELDPRERVLVRRASVLGLCFHRRLLPYVLDPGTAEPDEQTWIQMSGVFADDGDGYIRFKRPAVCEAAYESLPFGLRRRLHSAVGKALEPELGRDADADPAVLSLHFNLAGAHDRARQYAILGAERAIARFAHADAAQLYRRAIEAGRQSGSAPGELAAAWEALGKALQRTGELAAAAKAMTVARRLVPDDPLVQGRLFYWHTVIAEHAARLTTAVRWGQRGLRELDGLQEREAAVWRARTFARLAFYRGRQGRFVEAEGLCQAAVAEAEPIGELEALGYAYWTLDWVAFELGHERDGRYSELALEIYDRLGDLEQQGNVLNNLSVYAAEEWRWDEALSLLARSAECSQRAGIHYGVAATEVNTAEILIDQGLYDEARGHVRRAGRLWRSTEEPTGAAYVDVLSGRLAVRAGDHDEGLALLRDATEQLRGLGELSYTDFATSLLAEAEAYAGDPRRALEIAERLIDGADRALPLLHRVRAIALARVGDAAAGDALALALALARERDALYETALGLDLAESLWWPDPRRTRERDVILARLGVRRLPSLPVDLVDPAVSRRAVRNGQGPAAGLVELA
jgi:class 3 adenylate cyclase/tetratricopeptide (TPR) repeat protein